MKLNVGFLLKDLNIMLKMLYSALVLKYTGLLLEKFNIFTVFAKLQQKNLSTNKIYVSSINEITVGNYNKFYERRVQQNITFISNKHVSGTYQTQVHKADFKTSYMIK